jgi:hypothetical protein
MSFSQREHAVSVYSCTVPREGAGYASRSLKARCNTAHEIAENVVEYNHLAIGRTTEIAG